MKNTEVENFHYWSALVGRAGRSKNSRRHFLLIQYCFLANISPHTKFHPNRMKNTEVENFHYWSVLVDRAGRSKNGRALLFYVVFSPILVPKPNLIKIGQKTQKLKRLAICQLRLVDWVGQKIAIAITNLFYVVLCPMLPSITNFTQIG